MKNLKLLFLTALVAALSACQPGAPANPGANPNPATGALRVLAVESYLADMAQNVAGERAVVEPLIPLGLDPHAFEPTPRDIARITQSDVLIVNGAGFEEWLDDALKNAGGSHLLIEASHGLSPRSHSGEISDPDHDHANEIDPHFWFDPRLAAQYVENIRDGLIQQDPAGAETYTQNAHAYLAKLDQLDQWAAAQIEQIPPERRRLVTNHESFGYFADRYGLQIVGAVLPSVSSSASPSAKQLADLIAAIRAAGAPAIFLETGANPELAQQIAAETGVKVVTGLYTHSLSDPAGPAATYLDMMRYNITVITESLR